VSPTALTASFHTDLNSPVDKFAETPPDVAKFFRTSSTALFVDTPNNPTSSIPSGLERTLRERFFNLAIDALELPPFVICGFLERRNRIKDINANATIRTVARLIRDVKENFTSDDNVDFKIANVEGVPTELARVGGSKTGACVTEKRCFCLYFGFAVTGPGIGVAVREVLVELETDVGKLMEVIDIDTDLRMPFGSAASNLGVRGVAVSSLVDDVLEPAGDTGREKASEVGDSDGVEDDMRLRCRIALVSACKFSREYIRRCLLTGSN